MAARSKSHWKRLIVWKDRATWLPTMTEWLTRYLDEGAIEELRHADEMDLCWDDPDWLEYLQEFLDRDIELVIEDLAAELRTASIRLFHGCRTLDAGEYHRNGICRNDPKVLEARLRHMVATEDGFESFRPGIDALIEDFRDDRDRDKGRLFLGLHDQALVDTCGHYALYGSEWVMCVLGFAGHHALRNRGVPTIVEVDYPAKWMTHDTLVALATKLIQEFTHASVNKRPWIPDLDFSVVSRRDIPAEFVVGHSHPHEIKDYHHRAIVRRSPKTTCPHCDQTAAVISSA